MNERRLKEPPVIEVRNLDKAYRLGGRNGGEPIKILEGVDFSVAGGERVAIQGQSGVGKTTLLNLLGGLDRPDAGTVLHKGVLLPESPDARARWRRHAAGFIFQFHGLLSEFTALENVALAGLIAGWSKKKARHHASELLDKLGLMARARHYPEELSGGEQQRVATARALVTRPSLVLADEPTGNLDPKTGNQVLDLLIQLQEEQEFALVVATHSDLLAGRCHRVLRVLDGRLIESNPSGPVHEGGP